MRHKSPPKDHSLTGLSTVQAETARNKFGSNQLTKPESQTGWRLLVEVVSEPMFILLAIAGTLYVLLGQWQEGIILGIAMCLVSGISVFQTIRSDRALLALRQLTQPMASVLRDGKLTTIAVEQVVVGDTVWLTEGQTVPADGLLIQANDCAVDEAILTGESVPVSKLTSDTDQFFAGTLLVSGSAYVRITAVGGTTELDKLGRSLQAIKVEKTPLQLQINQFVRRMAVAGFGAFALVWGVNFAHSGNWATSLLLGLTIAMSVLPEEIPVAFSSFMALGAARMIRFGVLTKQPQTVESVGSATVICTDKTGTITQEGMTLAKLYDGNTMTELSLNQFLTSSARTVLSYARWASESEPFDSMERAIVVAYQRVFNAKDAILRPIIHEYPLGGTPPMMTHVYSLDTGPERVAGKGAVERIVRICHLSESDAARILLEANELAKQGYRVLGIAGSDWAGDTYPTDQDDFKWSFKGLIALENPPKPNAKKVIRQFGQAGITVKMITGDSPETAQAIARQVALPSNDRLLTGDQVMALSDVDLQQEVASVNVFARMFPEAKLRVIRALKAVGEVVAMTGDGVNDGPALKAAHIGVAMGKRGTELARQAASLVLVNDDLSGMVDAIAQGRRIYQNLKRAIGYIVSIHIPIILTVAIPLLFGWRYINLFSPIHVIFLELVMGPTCSIAFENEPAEGDLMKQPPRPLSDTFFTGGELSFRVLQGLAIALATLGIYYQMMKEGNTLEHVRTMTFLTLVLSNIWLTLVSRSDRASVLTTLRRPNRLLWLMLGLTIGMLTAILWLPDARHLAQFDRLAVNELGRCVWMSLAGVGWIEGYKLWKRQRSNVR
ncbi:cation-translocating P-type ATPase [Spirosoma pollinicola]|uniref:Haloacid dehalogenase n=1 Tax=Spirosoma pollinicola TaxID=2057025 RepID=A0A2K8Z310_9BACT|nr:cation-translocating P-type ATPase [Spirosoma pollinicola]AUD04268.1 haloacid dehalogenase [Spirosoma pollinicola]